MQKETIYWKENILVCEPITIAHEPAVQQEVQTTHTINYIPAQIKGKGGNILWPQDWI